MSGDRRNRLDVVSRGDLEDITKPSSSRSRTGSRVTSSQLGNSSATSTASRLRPQVAAALELLTPEEVMDQVRGVGLGLYGRGGDFVRHCNSKGLLRPDACIACGKWSGFFKQAHSL